MKNFDSLKSMWDEQSSQNPMDFSTAYKDEIIIDSKIKLQRQQVYGAILLIITAILITMLALFGNLNFKHWYTYGAMVLVCIICLLQSSILFYTYKKIKEIDDTTTPTLHLEQWETYYSFRKKQAAWNLPIYYIALNIAMGLYFIEVLTDRPLLNIIIFLLIYISWMVFSYFFWGKRNLKKEDTRLEAIIEDLKNKKSQFD